VCAVLAGSTARRAEVEALAGHLAGVRAPAVPKWDRETAQIMRRLALKAIGRPEEMTEGGGAAGAFDRPFAVAGWTAVSGMRISGWVDAPPGTEVEIRSGDRVVHTTTLGAPRDGGHGFEGQLVLEPGDDEITRLELVVPGGQDGMVCRSATGVLLGRFRPDTGFTLHCLDVRDGGAAREDAANGERERGRRLVAEIRARGERVRVDLGCGFRKEGNLGIDVTRDGTDADLVCVMGFEPIPLDDGVVDEVFCRDFLEHVPKGVYVEAERRMRYPVIDLFTEIWRVMAPGAVFTSLTPGYPEPEVHQDPTHLSVWTENSFGYFTGDYKLAANYGFPGAFEEVEIGRQGFYIKAVLRKPAGDRE
jgi:SAM-dependent methyltransferase